MALNSKQNSRKNTVETSVNDVVLNGVLAMLNSKRNTSDTWVGTMTDVGNAITTVMGRNTKKSMPGSPSALRVVLNRIAQRLRTRGIGVRFGRATDRTRTRFVKFTL
jgi:hypothetical protein